MRSTRSAAALFGIAFVVAACGSGSSEGSAVPATAEVPAATAPPTTAAVESTTGAPAPDDTPAVVVPAALQFDAPLVGGGRLDVTTLAGKPTVFWFWAPT